MNLTIDFVNIYHIYNVLYMSFRSVYIYIENSFRFTNRSMSMERYTKEERERDKP